MDEQSIFLEALNQPDAEARNNWLDQACGDDQELKQRLLKMIEKHQQASDFLEQPAPGLDETLAVDLSRENLTAALDAGLAAAFEDDAALVIGNADHSALRSIHNSLAELPQVSLREPTEDADPPPVRPRSPEVPKLDDASRYQLQGEIARGGMGAIIKGRDPDLGRDLAIKVLLDSHKDNPDVVRRFVEEAQIGGQLQHPGITPVYELGQFADQRPYFSMKLVKGKTLAKLLAERSDPTSDRGKFIGIFEQICQTMAYAHTRGVIHRDLKPANIMVGNFGEVQVMDWGLAKVLTDGGVADEKLARERQREQNNVQTLRDGLGSDALGGFGSDGSNTQLGSVMGTPAYMPPEQARGHVDDLDERADVFGLGAMLCEILTGQPAYVGDTATAVFGLATRGQLDDALARLDKCGADADLLALAVHCLKLEPQNRPRDASAVAERVTAYLESVETKLRDAEKQHAVATARAEEERKLRRVQLTLIASVLFLLALGGAGWIYMEQRSIQRQRVLTAQKQEQRNAAEATRLIEGLLLSETRNVPPIIHNIRQYRKYTHHNLRRVFAESPERSNAKLHAALALLAEDESMVPFLQQRLLDVTAQQFATVRDLLENHHSDLVEDYWQIATESESAKTRFQALCALATYAPQDARWQDDRLSEFISHHMVSVLPSELLPWRNALRPLQSRLTTPLATIYRDASRSDQVRTIATETLADYLRDDAERLFDLLADATETQFSTIFDTLAVYQTQAIELGVAEIAKIPGDNASAADKEALAIRQANAAVLLVRMGNPEPIWPLFKHRPEPRLRSYLIHWLSARGADPQLIIDRYPQETDVTAQRALLLCLGEFEESDLPQRQRQLFTELLLNVYRKHPDAGLHAASEWLLKQWGQTKLIAKIDNQTQQTEEQLAAESEPQRQWYINSQGQTFVILDAEAFMMGSPEDEVGRLKMEAIHQRQIGRRFAIATKEITKEQWREFTTKYPLQLRSADDDNFKPYCRTEDSPILAISWFHAAWYCNWLSEQEGIPKEQWCYEPSDSGKFGPDMRAKRQFWKLTGYRLPTEAEWEFACRAGTNTSRYYGQTSELLPEYAWYGANGKDHSWPVGMLKPNDFGLFDMHGNVEEWNHGLLGTYATTANRLYEDAPFNDRILAVGARAMRGGSFLSVHTSIRCAARNAHYPYRKAMDHGFRPARTFYSSPRPSSN